MNWRFGQPQDAANAEAAVTRRRERLARMATESWPMFLLKVALSIVALFLLASVVVALFGR